MKLTKTTRGLAALMGGIMLMGGLSGCGSNESADGDTITISVASYFPDEETEPENYQRHMDVVKEFEAAYPNVKVVDPKWTFDLKNYIAMAEGGTTPTTYHIPLTECNKIIKAGYAADITEEYKSRGLYDITTDFMLEQMSNDGRIYMLPAQLYDQGIVVNVDLYKQAGFVSEDGTLYQPETWEDLARVAQKCKEVTGADGFAISTKGTYGGWRFTPIAWSYGTVFETETEDGKWQATFNSPECAEALQFVKDLKWKYDVLPANTLLSVDEINESFAGENLVMFLGEKGQADKAITLYGMDKDKIGMLSMPAGPAKKVTLLGGGMYVISNTATPEQIKAVMDFYDFIGRYTISLTDDVKARIDKDIEQMKVDNKIIGIEGVSAYKADSEVREYSLNASRQNANVDLKHFENYNNKENIEFQAEEPQDAQSLYKLLSSAVEEVLNNKDADVNKLLKDAANDFQRNNLDYIN